MKQNQEQRYAVLFEALKKSLLVLHRVRRRLSLTLAEIELKLVAGAKFDENAADALIDVISLVDFAHRFGALADALPLISKSEVAMKQLRGALYDIEAARNYLQHIRGDLSTTAGLSYPVLGGVIWSTGFNTYSLQFSQAIEADIKTQIEVSRSGSPGPQSRLKFRYKHEIAHVDRAIDEADKVYKWICGAVTCSDPRFSNLEWGDTLLALCRGSR